MRGLTQFRLCVGVLRQIHTTGMDIKHVVNAMAVITLGKDMVFRDYVQVQPSTSINIAS